MKTLKLDWIIIILKNKRKHTIYFLILASDDASLSNPRRTSDWVL